MNNLKQRIRTIDVKAFLQYFPKREGEKFFTMDFSQKALCRLVIKQEEEMENCPVFDQFYEEMKSRIEATENFEITANTLTDKLVVMDFGDIFMPCDDTVSEKAKSDREYVQQCVRDMIENGFDVYPEQSETPVHMVAFDKSGNMSRKSRISFVDAAYYDALNDRLNLGMDFSKIQVQESKYYSYRGLYLSSAQRIEHKGLLITPQTLIVLKDERKDPEKPGRFIAGSNYERKVKYITAKENKETSGEYGKVWDIQAEQEKEFLFVDTPFDGVGFISPKYAAYINQSLGTSNATSFQLRLPFMKGMLHSVDVQDFLDTYNGKEHGQAHMYEDAFGIKRNLRKACIFVTESMFKGKKWLIEHLKHTEKKYDDPMEYYCEMLEKYQHALYVSGTNLPYGHSKYVHLSYQTINTLQFTDDQFEKILNRHTGFIEKPEAYLDSFDFEKSQDEETSEMGETQSDDETQKTRFDDKLIEAQYVDESQDSDLDDMPWENEEPRMYAYVANWKRALHKNTNLMDDIFIQGELRNTQKGLLTKLVTGKILVEGQTRYLCRDLLPLLVSMLEKPDINKWFYIYLYYRFYLPVKGTDKVAEELGLNFNSYYAFFRNPHLSRNEQYIMRRFSEVGKDSVVDSTYEEAKTVYDKYFGKLSGIVMVPRHSVMPLCLGGADFDGDLVSVVYNQEVVSAVAAGTFRVIPNEKYGDFYQRALPVIEIPSTKSQTTTVKEHVPYEHIRNTFSNRIGQISDAAISIGQTEYGHALTESQMQVGETMDHLDDSEIKKAGQPTCEMCTILTGLEIDAAKNGEHPDLRSILNNDVKQSEYIKFLRKFNKLRSEEGYAFYHLMVTQPEEDEEKTQENRRVKITAKGGKTVAVFEPPTFGTYINKMPIAFFQAFQSYEKQGKKKGKGGNKQFFLYDEHKAEAAEKIREFQSACQIIFDYYVFYIYTLLRKVLQGEKSKKYHAAENFEMVLYQVYDEEEARRFLKTVVPSLVEKLGRYLHKDNSIAQMKNRLNEKKWLFTPREQREKVLEEIVGGGFRTDILNEEEKELLLHFRNHGYKNLWLVLTMVEGPKTATFEEIMQNIKCPIENKDQEFEQELQEYLRDYYNHNSTDVMQKIYAACLSRLKMAIRSAELSEENCMAALYEMTAAYADHRKFFWDAFDWKTLDKYLRGEEAND